MNTSNNQISFYQETEFQIREGMSNNYVIQKAKFSFLENISSQHFTEEKFKECLDNSLILNGDLNAIKYYGFNFYNLYSKNSKFYDMFWEKQVHLKKHPKIQNIMEEIIEDIILSTDMEHPSQIENFFNFLNATEKNIGPINWDHIRDMVSLGNQNFLLETMIEKQKLNYSLEENLKFFFRNLNNQSLEIFLNHSQNFYIDYGKKHQHLGYGYIFHHHDENSTSKIEILQKFFKNHPDYNHQRWAQTIFQDDFFEEQIPFFKNFSLKTKQFLTTILEENPSFFNIKLNTKGREEYHYSKPIETLKDLLEEYATAAPLLEIYYKYEKEKTLQNTLKPNNSLKPSKRF